MFELAEPYRSTRNTRYRYHDASLYKGRYYVYFGVVPALVAFVPWRLAGLGDLPQPVAVVAFSLLGFVFSALLLRRLLWRHLEAAPGPLVQVLAFLVLGLANVTPFILRSPRVYEVAIAAGYAFSAGAAWLLATAGARGTLSPRRLALGGLFLGLAVGCRPNLVLLVPILPLLALLEARPASIKAAVRPALAYLAPLAVCGVALGLYNYARFDSWTEFGTRYQLLGVSSIALFEPRAMVPALFYAFLAPPALRIDFPFVFPDHRWAWSRPDGLYLDPIATGAFAHSPFLWILLALPWILRGAPVREGSTLRRQLLVLVAAGLVVPVVTALVFASTAMRFQVDYVHFLAVPALVLWFVLAARLGDRRRTLFRALVAVVFGVSVLISVALSLTGVLPLSRSNPDLFANVEGKALPLRRALGWVTGKARAVEHLRVAFPERTAAESEPFLSWGRIEAFDVLWVRTVTPGVFSFSLDTDADRSRPPDSRPSSPGVGFVPGRFYDLEVEIDRVARRVSVSVDGQHRFALEGRFVPVASRHVWPARGPRGTGARNIGHFSGTMIPEDMWVAGPPGLESLPPIGSEPAILTASRTPAPPRVAPGRLWAVADSKGAFLATGEQWRWVPVGTLGSVVVERRVADLAIPPSGPDVAPVLTSGDGDGADGLVVARQRDGRVRVALAEWDGSWTLGEASSPLALADRGDSVLRVLLSRRDREAVVWLDDEEVLRAPVELRPIRPDRLRIGRPPRRSRSGRPAPESDDRDH